MKFQYPVEKEQLLVGTMNEYQTFYQEFCSFEKDIADIYERLSQYSDEELLDVGIIHMQDMGDMKEKYILKGFSTTELWLGYSSVDGKEDYEAARFVAKYDPALNKVLSWDKIFEFQSSRKFIDGKTLVIGAMFVNQEIDSSGNIYGDYVYMNLESESHVVTIYPNYEEASFEISRKIRSYDAIWEEAFRYLDNKSIVKQKN